MVQLNRTSTKMVSILEIITSEERLKEMDMFSLNKRRLKGDMIRLQICLKGMFEKGQ